MKPKEGIEPPTFCFMVSIKLFRKLTMQTLYH